MPFPDCVFCTIADSDRPLIRTTELVTSFVSSPWFRPGQCLVIPNRHVITAAELTPEEGAAIMNELGRLSTKLDTGFGTGIMQKYQPLQAENGIKVSHLHFHVFPRVADEAGLFPVPTPNSFDGFTKPDEGEVAALTASLKEA